MLSFASQINPAPQLSTFASIMFLLLLNGFLICHTSNSTVSEVASLTLPDFFYAVSLAFFFQV